MNANVKPLLVPSAYERDLGPTVLICRLEHPTLEGEFMLQLIEKHALITAEDNGEDSAGRQKMRKQTALEIVSAAAEITEEAFGEMRARNWTVRSPDLEPLWVEHMAKRERERDENAAGLLKRSRVE